MALAISMLMLTGDVPIQVLRLGELGTFGINVMNKRALYFFGRRDEEEVSETLHRAFPALKFVDGQRWPQPEPPTTGGIHLCKASLVYLWPSDVVSELPSFALPPAMRLSGNLFQGPSSGPVMQFCRCLEKDGELELGQLSAYIEDSDSPLGKSHARVIAFLKKQYSCRMDCFSSRTGELLNGNIGGYLVGRSIQRNSANSPRLRLALGRDEYMVPRSIDAE